MRQYYDWDYETVGWINRNAQYVNTAKAAIDREASNYAQDHSLSKNNGLNDTEMMLNPPVDRQAHNGSGMTMFSARRGTNY